MTKNQMPPKPVFEFPEPPQHDIHMEVKSILEEKLPSTPKLFEPKVVSTPVSKSRMDYESDANFYKAAPSYEIQKSVSDTKVSPTNSIVKGLIASKKAGRKKNSLAASKYTFILISIRFLFNIRITQCTL